MQQQSEVAAKAEACARNFRDIRRYIEKDGSQDIEEKLGEEEC